MSESNQREDDREEIKVNNCKVIANHKKSSHNKSNIYTSH